MGRSGILALAGSLVAGGLAGPLAGQLPPRRDLFLLRHGTDGAVSLYAGHSAGPVLLIAGTLRQPGPGHLSAIGAVGTDLRLAAASRVLVALGYADLSSGRFARLYLLPRVRVGRLAANGTVSIQQPVSARGRRQVGIDPAGLTYRVTRRLDVGVVALASLPSAQRARLGMGPEVRVRAGRAALELGVLRRGPTGWWEGRFAVSARW